MYRTGLKLIKFSREKEIIVFHTMLFCKIWIWKKKSGKLGTNKRNKLDCLSRSNLMIGSKISVFNDTCLVKEIRYRTRTTSILTQTSDSMSPVLCIFYFDSNFIFIPRSDLNRILITIILIEYINNSQILNEFDFRINQQIKIFRKLFLRKVLTIFYNPRLIRQAHNVSLSLIKFNQKSWETSFKIHFYAKNSRISR